MAEIRLVRNTWLYQFIRSVRHNGQCAIRTRGGSGTISNNCPGPTRNRSHSLGTLRDQAVIVQGVINGDMGRPVDHIRQDLPGKGPSGICLPENIETLVYSDDVFAAKQCGDLIPRAILFMETLKKGLVIKFPARNFLSQLLYHLFFPKPLWW